MVNGIDIFREHFNHFKEQYTVIGAFACDLLMEDLISGKPLTSTWC